MKKMLARVSAVAGTVLAGGALPVLANAPAGEGAPDYSGITGLYYIIIGVILAYGVYDSFLKKS